MVGAERVTSYCGSCRRDHDGRMFEKDGGLYLEVSCPAQVSIYPISSDARLHALFRRRAAQSSANRADVSNAPQIGVLEITDRCDITCPICYADAGPDGEWLIDLASVERAAVHAEAAGLRWITLTGGEPTLHPQLPAIVATLRRRGLRPLLATNGLRLARDPALQTALQDAGLCKVQVQFDTLVPATYATMRGRRDPQEKQEIVDILLQNGFRVGLVVTVVDENLPELADIVKFAVARMPALNSVLLQRGVPVGRFPDSVGRRRIDREKIVRATTQGLDAYKLQETDFFPSPYWPAGNLAVHADCFAAAVLVKSDQTVRPLNHSLDLEQVYEKLPTLGGAGKSLPARLRLAALIVRHLRIKTFPALARAMWGFWRGHGQHGLLFINIGDNMDAGYLHHDRLRCCSTCLVTAEGLVGVCQAFHRNATRLADGAAAEE